MQPVAVPDRVFPLPTGEEGAWIARARPVSGFACEAVFAIARSVYVGPENNIERLDWDTANVRLPPVDLPRRFVDRATTAELLGREEVLAAHYRRIVGILEAHGRAGSPGTFPYFRIQPEIVADDAPLTEFSWTDDFHETRTVLEAFVEAAEGAPRLVHWDQDQGWGVRVAVSAVATCLVEWDAEGPPPAGNGLAFDREELARQAAAALERLGIVHARLVAATGRDHWR